MLSFFSASGNTFAIYNNVNTNHPKEHFVNNINDFVTNNKVKIKMDGLLVMNMLNNMLDVWFFNNDGSTGMMCGNGGRCSVYYYYKYFSDNKRRFHFLMNGRPYEGRMTKSIVYIYFPTPFARAFRHKIQTEIGEFESIFIDVGTPHECIEVSNIDTVDMKYLGPLIRKEAEHKPEGANVSFYQQQSPTKVLIRTYERGLECESNACGSGAVAVGSILVDRQGYQGQITFVPTSKEILVIEVEAYQAPKRDGTRPVRNIILGGFVKEL